jgi:L-ascorbate metabolism protein UlaG (beta-lactamase superfamily)
MRFTGHRVAEAVLWLLLSAPVMADVVITRLANEGVLVSDGDTRIMIDGLVTEPYSIYGGLPQRAAAQLESATGPFDAVDLALVSHRHHDHNQPGPACRFMQAADATRLATSAQVIGLMREKCRSFMTTSERVRKIAPTRDSATELVSGSAQVRVFPLSHGRRKYAKIQNFGHLLKLGGVTLLHVGDAAMDPADFELAGLEGVSLDVAFIPFWYFQPGPGLAVVERFLDAALKVAVHIPPGEMGEVREHLALEFPDVLVLEEPLQAHRVRASHPPTD